MVSHSIHEPNTGAILGLLQDNTLPCKSGLLRPCFIGGKKEEVQKTEGTSRPSSQGSSQDLNPEPFAPKPVCNPGVSPTSEWWR